MPPAFFDYNTFWSINCVISTFSIPTVLIPSYTWHWATKDSFGRFSTGKSKFTENPLSICAFSWDKILTISKLQITPYNFHHVQAEGTRNHLHGKSFGKVSSSEYNQSDKLNINLISKTWFYYATTILYQTFTLSSFLMAWRLQRVTMLSKLM